MSTEAAAVNEETSNVPSDSEKNTLEAHARKKSPRLRIDELEAEADLLEIENDHLKRENAWLQSEVSRLEKSLADASQKIYSLEKKLDAIFRPNHLVE